MSTAPHHVIAAALAGDPTADDPELQRLLDVAEDEVAHYGFARTSLNDIARKAGVSRPTAYRRLGNKDNLLRHLLLRAARTFFVEFESAVADIDDVEGRAAEAFVVGLRTAQVHPLAGHLLASEPEVMQPALAGEGAGFIEGLREPVKLFLDPEGRSPREAVAASEMLIRLATSFLLTPTSVLDTEDDAQMRALGRGAIAGAIAGLR